MLFSELYSAYYNAVAKMLSAAQNHALSREEMRRIVEECAFEESILTIEPAFSEGRWQLLNRERKSILAKSPEMPLTTLQKQWMNAIALDPRMKLFTDEPVIFPEVPPLFTPEMITVFDRYHDGDPYEDETYRKIFRMVLSAIREGTALRIETLNRKGKPVKRVIRPRLLEYSEKDDKFRVIASGIPDGGTYNLARILSCSVYHGEYQPEDFHDRPVEKRSVTFELFDQRNALERVLLHFAHFEKEAEKTDEDRYLVTIRYEVEDETEMVIRILSFGPLVKVTEPEEFVTLMKNRLFSQKSCGL